MAWNVVTWTQAHTQQEDLQMRRSFKLWVRIGGVGVVLGCVAAAGGVQPARSSATVVKSVSGNQDELLGVAALSPANAWAVGVNCASGGGCGLPQSGGPLIVHWTGTGWTNAAVSGLGSSVQANFEAVSADSPNDVWAVGFLATTTSPYETSLIAHWNGSAWSVSRSGFAGGWLYGVSAISADDVWAVGYENNMTGSFRTLIVHWNGAAWSRVAAPSPGGTSGLGAQLTAVTSVSADDVWAVGRYKTDANPYGVRLILHWNGTAWSRVASPNPHSTGSELNGVSALSANSIWAAGTYCTESAPDCSPTGLQSLALRWNGTGWPQETTPDPNGTDTLAAVAAQSSTDVWAVGSGSVPGAGVPYDTLITHWNGEDWSQVPSPNPSTDDNFLYAVSADAGNDAWAVGYYCASSCPDGINDWLALHWNGTTWSQT
jgi:hypothetical protein